MSDCLIGFGANLGDRGRTWELALEQIRQLPLSRLVDKSSGNETVPIGGPKNQSPYLNAAIRIETSLSADHLLRELLAIENRLGRVRETMWSARAIDLDLLLYGQQIVQTPDLVVPHPRMAFRRFVLESAAEVAAEMIHPGCGWSVARLLDHLNQSANYVALSGPRGTGKTALAQQIASRPERQTTNVRTETATATETAGSKSDATHKSGPGPDLGNEIELLQRRTDWVRSGWDQIDSGAMITDFWMGQSLAYGNLLFKAEQAAMLRKRYDALQTTAIKPRLLVLLEHTPEPNPDEKLTEELKLVARELSVGPILLLNASDSERVEVEVSAALLAMR